MTVIRLSWYLCLLFIVALAADSAITFTPGGEAMVRTAMGALAVLATVFAVIAVAFRRMRQPEPKWLVRVFQAVALAATVVVAMMVVG
jgi:uncharacterized membrane protein YhaH (DUF805 family)